MQKLVAQLAKAPIPGKVKTRMMPFLNSEQACDLHRILTRQVFNQLYKPTRWQYELHVSHHHPYFKTFVGYSKHGDPHLVKSHLQCEGDLGQRMAKIAGCAQKNKQFLVLVGSDCPFLVESHIAQLFLWLQHTDCQVAVIPALDGGYVAMAIRPGLANYDKIFSDVQWGGSRVFQQTLDNLNRLELKYKVAEPMADIDLPNDLDKIKMGSWFEEAR